MNASPNKKGWYRGHSAQKVKNALLTFGRGEDAGLQDDRASAPRRPSVSLALFVAAALFLGVLAGETACWQLLQGTENPQGSMRILCAGAGAACVLTLSLSVLLAVRGHMRTASLCATLASLSFGFCAFTAHDLGWLDEASALEGAYAGEVEAVVTGDVSIGDYYSSSEARLATDAGEIDVKLYWPSSDDALPAGTKARLRASVKAMDIDSGSARSWHQQGICGSVSVTKVVNSAWRPGPLGAICAFRESVLESLASIEGDGAALVDGVVMGDRTRLFQSGAGEAFRVCGLSHLIAVSGSHLAVVASLASYAVRRLRLSPALRFAFLALMLACYVVLTGCQISAIRSFLMTSICLFGVVVGRRYSSLSALSVVLCLLLAADPVSAFSLSLRLSALAVLGISLFTVLLDAWGACALPFVPRAVTQSAALTLSCLITTVGLTAYVFQTVSTVSVPANVIAGPLVSVLLGCGVAAALLCGAFPFLSPFLLTPLCAFGNLICQIAEKISLIPYASIDVGLPGWACVLALVAPSTVLWCVWPRPKRRVALAALALATALHIALLVAPTIHADARVVMLDVGQGDAMLIEDGEDSLLIDAGTVDGELDMRLREEGVGQLDAVVITHLHDDHYGGLPLLDGFDVGAVYFARGVEEEYESSEAYRQARQLVGDEGIGYLDMGDKLSFGNFVMEVVWPGEFTDDGGNQDSICCLVTYDDDSDGIPEHSLLATGDAEAQTVQEVIAQGGIGKVEYLKVGHHGSKPSLSERLLSVLDPDLALISVGEGNSYGHPSQMTLDLLEDAGVEVMRTDEEGSVALKMR